MLGLHCMFVFLFSSVALVVLVSMSTYGWLKGMEHLLEVVHNAVNIPPSLTLTPGGQRYTYQVEPLVEGTSALHNEAFALFYLAL